MKVLDSQCDATSLAGMGKEAAEFIVKGDYQGLADRFGYALAFDKDPVDAIRADVKASLSESGSSLSPASPKQPEITVRYFKVDHAPFVALVECRLALTDPPGNLLAELIVTTNGYEKHVTLEQIS